MKTLASRSSRRRAIAYPIPARRLTPVTSALRPLRSKPATFLDAPRRARFRGGDEARDERMRLSWPRPGLEAEQRREEERVLVELDNASLAVGVDPGHPHARLLERRPVALAQAVVAEVILDRLVPAIERGCPRSRDEAHALRLADERARERRDDERVGIRARFRMVCLFDPERVPCVLDQYVLETTSGADKRDA